VELIHMKRRVSARIAGLLLGAGLAALGPVAASDVSITASVTASPPSPPVATPSAPSVTVPLPDMAPALTTDGVTGLEDRLSIALPPPPEPAIVTLPPAERHPVPTGEGAPVLLAIDPEPPPSPLPRLAIIGEPPPPVLPWLAIEPGMPPGSAEASLSRPAMVAALDRIANAARLPRRVADSVLAFHDARDNRPFWTTRTGWSPEARVIRRVLALAHEHGLDPADYRSVSAFLGGPEAVLAARATAEIEFSVAVIRYVRDLRLGRIEPRRIHPLVTPKISDIFAVDVLEAVARSDDPAAVLDAHAPPHEGYRALKARLAEVRAARPAPAAADIPVGRTLRIGARDPRVPLIRLAMGMGLDSTADLYDRALALTVAARQRDLGLRMTGQFDEATRLVLTGQRWQQDEAEIIANMELWRFVPRELGDDHIMVNTPSYRMELVRNGVTVFEARTIVGKDETQTPFFSDEMDHIVVNPSWYVPPGILKRDPRYLDPAWAAARGYEIRTRGRITTVRVPPSASNALGAVKFMFPNDHAVYLHDTNARQLFGAGNRALSNGCVRVENPMRLAAHLFADEGWTEERFRRLIGGGERPMRLRQKLPIHLVYLTMTPDGNGGFDRHPDIYGHVARLGRLLQER
jgi:L,D-transpeptidase YcbB